MFKFVNRSKSVRKGAPASVHGPESPYLPADDRRLVSSRQPSKQDQPGFHNEGMPSPSASSLGLPGSAGGSHLHPSSPLYPPLSPASTMQDRPRTSSGPGPNKASAAPSFKDFEKRKSKDDLSLMSRGSARGGYKSYHIPIRGKPPSPSDNGRDVSPARTIPVRTQTPESIADNNGIITIGMAIGSPTHPRMGSYGSEWPSQADLGGGPATAGPEVFPLPEPTAPPAQTPQRSKSTRWRLFGRSKSKRAKPEPAPQDEPVALPSQSSGLDRSNTERYAPKHKPIIVRADTLPNIRSTDDPADASSSTSPRPTTSGRSTLKPTDVPSSALGKNQGPLLDVEIPDVTMERYSIMFGGLLQSTGSSSSLLARRQATLERLRTINDRIVTEQDRRDPSRPRRATSPMHERSPSLSMFPTPPPTAPSPMTPRTRSATVPAGLPANPRDGGHDRNRQTRMQASSVTKVHDTSKDDTLTPTLTQAPSKAGQRRQEKNSSKDSVFSQDHSSLVLDSPTEESSSDYHIKEQLRPDIYEPKWEMVSPSLVPASNQSSRNASMGLAAQTQSSSSSSSRTAAASTPINTAQRHAKKTSEEAFDEEQLNAAVEISIARQISISQQQRDMLRKNIGGGGGAGVRRIKVPRGDRQAVSPARLSPMPPSGTGTGSGTVIGSGSGKLTAIPSSTPTLITPPEPFVGSPLAQHRKSERIVVEGA